ncbi:aldo/keto reductase [Tundrisphaera lichenicola]|uniref:aldo/keto reductase n=1 Tax=Tundrisphaera lichenicola TaxID=2029860 RepID=UPI003EB91E70
MSVFEMRQLGGSDVRVTPVIFGAWAVGGWMWGGSDEAESIAAIRASIDHGVTTIDTAAVYGQGYGEEVVGKAIRGLRDKVQIATKCGMRWDAEGGSDPWQTQDREGNTITIRRNSRPDSIPVECERSLKRMGVDVIDLYQVHWPDTTTPVEETMAALVKLQEQGKIRAIGVSNYDAMWIKKAAAVSPLSSLQPPYSLIQRKIEKEILPLCREHGIGVIVYSPMERGLLTGSVPPDRVFPPGDHRTQHKFFTVDHRRRVMDTLDKVRPIAEKHGVSLAQMVINWTIQEPGITAAIVGARNSEQAEHNAKALSFRLSPEECSEIRRAFDETSAAMMGG